MSLLLLLKPKGRVTRLKLTGTRYLTLSNRGDLFDATPPGYEVNVSAEPLSKYRPGGYHPIHLGAQFKYGRYRVTHKLGWGGEGTVWLARDIRASRLVALKVLIADESGRNEESALLKRLFGGTGTPVHPGVDHLTQLLDDFWHTGPNGTHECLVLDVAGSTAQDQAEKYPNSRLPAQAAWSIAKQIVLAVDRLHTMGVAHADIHTRNIMLSPTARHYSSPNTTHQLPKPYVADVNALPPYELNQHMPKYLVESTPLPYTSTDPSLWHAQLVDLGQSFHASSAPKKSRTPMVLQAPELLLSGKWDHNIDIWSLACTIFELVTGRPPFDPVNPSVNRLVQEWIGLFGDLPDGWKPAWSYSTQWGDDEEIGITNWLKQSYFERAETGSEHSHEHPGFSEEDLDSLGDLLEQLFRYKPEERLGTEGVLNHEWFTKSPFYSKGKS